MKFCYLILLSIVSAASFGQVQRAFITKDGRYSGDPKEAVSYVLIKKMDGDSAYAVKQYDMHDTIMTAGIYKDELLTIPNGRFLFYNKNRLSKDFKKNFPTLAIDTNNYVANTGYYLNGKREGIWLHFSSRGVIGQRSTYANDKMNGPFSTYTGGEVGYRSEGTMIDDVLEGKYYIYNADSLLLAESDYVHNKEVKQTMHLVEASESEKFHAYMEKTLEKYKPQLVANVPEVRYVVTKTGTLKDIQIVKGISPGVDAAILAALAKAPPFTPGTYDGAVFDEKITRLLLVYHDYVNGPSGQQGLPHLTHYRQRFDSLIPQPQADGTIKPGVNYQH